MILSEVQSLCAYDSLGRKTSRTDNDTCEYYIYDGMNLVADYDAYNGRITRTYSYGPGVDNIQSMTIYDEYGGSETYYYIKDASNTVYGLVDVNNEIVEYYHYDAFGNFKIKDNYYLWIPESAYGNRFLFQGREYDYATQLYYFRNRWYEPETGRWLSPDPIGISGGLNLYAFCGNDPVNFVDPMGLAQLKNGTGRPVIVSGNLGDDRGKGPQFYSVIPPNQEGEDVCWGGENHPLNGYPTMKDAINAFLGDPIKSAGSIKDIDFFYQSIIVGKIPSLSSDNSSTHPLIESPYKISGNFTYTVEKQDDISGCINLTTGSKRLNRFVEFCTPFYDWVFPKK